MAKKKIQSVKFKRDYMMLLAFLLFFMIVVSECFLAVWLPWHLKLEAMWAEQVARQELIDQFDKVRGQSRKASTQLTPPGSSEEALICRSLDRSAAFMHQNGKYLTPQQCRGFMDILQRLYLQHNTIQRDKNNAYSREIKFSSRTYLENLRGREPSPDAPAAR
jgi:hypothetical protein